MDKSQGNLVHHVIFQCPTKIGKGVLVAPTVDGNLIVGPTSTNTTVDDYSTTSMGLKTIRENAVKSVPNMKLQENIRTFAGLRARSDKKILLLVKIKMYIISSQLRVWQVQV